MTREEQDLWLQEYQSWKRVRGPQDDDELHALIVEKFDLNIPRVAVCTDLGHQAPFTFLADLYFERTLTAFAMANRGGSKTFIAALWLWLCATFRPGTEGASVATEQQTMRAYEHLKKIICMDGDVASESKHPDIESSVMRKTTWQNKSLYEIIIATLKGTSGPHPHKVHTDEVEWIDPPVFENSRNMSATSRGILAQDVLTSTRYRAHGLVQAIWGECDDAISKGFKPPYDRYTWCLFECLENQPNCQVANPDTTTPCECDKVVKGQWESGEPRRFSDYCQGRGARSDGWIPIEQAHKVFQSTTRDVFEAQQLCIKPSTEGLVLAEFDRNRHGVRAWLPNPAHGPIFGSVDFGGCYDEETEVLTARGWVSWPQIRDDDEFASLDPETELVEFQAATEIVRKPYHGFMNQWKNKNVDLLVTADHNMLIRPMKGGAWSLVPSALVPETSKMLKTSSGLKDSWDEDTFCLEDLAIPSETWAAFLGFWMAEGHTSLGGLTPAGSQRKTGQVGLTHLNMNNRAEIKEMLAPFFNVREASNGNQLLINDPRLYRHLAQFGKAGDKFLPDYVKAWSPRLLRIYLDWHMRGDGDGRRIYTGSTRLADDLQEIAIYAGFASNVTYRPPRDSEIDGRKIKARLPQFVVSLNAGQTEPDVYRAPGRGEPTRTTITPDEWGRKMVYCAVLPKYHTLLVRRNGVSVWCGNTNPHAVVFIQLLKEPVLAHGFHQSSNDDPAILLEAGTRVVFDEIYIAEIAPSKLADLVVERMNYWRRHFPGFNIMKFFYDIQAKGARLEWAHHKPPIILTNYAPKDVQLHITYWKDLFEDNKFFVNVSRCPNLTNEMEAWHYPDNKAAFVDAPDQPVKDFDHAVDATRYGLANIRVIERKGAKEPGQGLSSGGGHGTSTQTGAGAERYMPRASEARPFPFPRPPDWPKGSD